MSEGVAYSNPQKTAKCVILMCVLLERLQLFFGMECRNLNLQYTRLCTDANIELFLIV
jgi:hypothetical protein